MYIELPELCSGIFNGTAISINPMKSNPVNTGKYKFLGSDYKFSQYNYTTTDFDTRLQGVLTVEFMDDFNMSDSVSQKVNFSEWFMFIFV